MRPENSSKTRSTTDKTTNGTISRHHRKPSILGIAYARHSDTAGCDGSQWIIEGIKKGKYHVVDRWSPAKGAVHDLGLAFALGLAQLRIPKDQLY